MKRHSGRSSCNRSSRPGTKRGRSSYWRRQAASAGSPTSGPPPHDSVATALSPTAAALISPHKPTPPPLSHPQPPGPTPPRPPQAVHSQVQQTHSGPATQSHSLPPTTPTASAPPAPPPNDDDGWPARLLPHRHHFPASQLIPPSATAPYCTSPGTPCPGQSLDERQLQRLKAAAARLPALRRSSPEYWQQEAAIAWICGHKPQSHLQLRRSSAPATRAPLPAPQPPEPVAGGPFAMMNSGGTDNNDDDTGAARNHSRAFLPSYLRDELKLPKPSFGGDDKTKSALEHNRAFQAWVRALAAPASLHTHLYMTTLTAKAAAEARDIQDAWRDQQGDWGFDPDAPMPVDELQAQLAQRLANKSDVIRAARQQLDSIKPGPTESPAMLATRIRGLVRTAFPEQIGADAVAGRYMVQAYASNWVITFQLQSALKSRYGDDTYSAPGFEPALSVVTELLRDITKTLGAAEELGAPGFGPTIPSLYTHHHQQPPAQPVPRHTPQPLPQRPQQGIIRPWPTQQQPQPLSQQHPDPKAPLPPAPPPRRVRFSTQLPSASSNPNGSPGHSSRTSQRSTDEQLIARQADRPCALCPLSKHLRNPEPHVLNDCPYILADALTAGFLQPQEQLPSHVHRLRFAGALIAFLEGRRTTPWTDGRQTPKPSVSAPAPPTTHMHNMHAPFNSPTPSLPPSRARSSLSHRTSRHSYESCRRRRALPVSPPSPTTRCRSSRTRRCRSRRTRRRDRSRRRRRQRGRRRRRTPARSPSPSSLTLLTPPITLHHPPPHTRSPTSASTPSVTSPCSVPSSPPPSS